MQTWAKRGLQTALVTGGLLMLGTGIASADEDVNPDKPASPLDGSVTVPVHIDDNALGTPLGQKNLPSIHKDVNVSVAGVVGAVPMADKVAPAVTPAVAATQAKAQDTVGPVTDNVGGQAKPILDKVNNQVADKTKPVLDKVDPLTEQASAVTGKAGLPTMPAMPALPMLAVPNVESAFNGNRVDGDLVVPVDISGNAIALLGQADVVNDSSHEYNDSETVVTDGAGGFLAGNVVDLDWALPVQITGNAVAGLGRATATGTSSQDTSTTTDIITDGSGGALSGNVVAGQGATPVQVTGNSVAGGGWANSTSQADTSATSGGYVLTSGADGAGSGNAGAAPVATPVEVNGNAIAGAGESVTASDSTADAQAGAERPGLYNVPTYVETNGDPALASGNVAQTPVSGPALLCGNAGAAAGGADAACASDSETDAGGTNRSTGAGSVASGAIAEPAVALPAEGYGNAAAGVGTADATADNTVDSTAGGDSYTRGHDSVASGTTASGAASGPVDVFANSVAAAGDADSTASQDANATSGGHTGTTGDDSAAGGNQVTTPVSTPVEGMGNTAAGAGGASASATETKVSSAGGGSNTDDDNGVLASNLVTTPVAGAAQAFGNSAGAAAFTDAEALIDNEVTAGGPSKATGTAGLGSGNIGQVPVSLPAQVFGTGASGAANGEQTADATTELVAGGDATSDGTGGLLAGNVATGPVASAGQVFGESAAALGLNQSEASSVTDSTAGGDTSTSGAGGLGTGNVVAPQALPVAQSFAAVASGVGGFNSSTADNATDATSGGDIDTVGDGGFLAGNLVDVPAAAVAQPFGDAVSAVESSSAAVSDSETDGTVGGTSTTSGGGFGSLSGMDATVPVGADVPIYDVPAEVLAQAFTESTNDSDVAVGEGQPQLDLPVSGGMLPNELPSMTPMRSMGSRALPDPMAGSFTGVLDGFANGMAGLPGQDTVSTVADTVSGAGGYHVLPAMGSRSDVPFPPISGDLFDVGLPLANGVPAVPAVPTVPAVGDVTDVAQLPAVPAVPEVPAVPAVPQVGDVTDLAQLPAVPAVPEVPAAVPAVPAVPADVTTVLPAFGDLAPGEVTEVVPTVPAVPAAPQVGDVADLPELDTVLDNGSLDVTRAALASLFAVHPIG